MGKKQKTKEERLQAASRQIRSVLETALREDKMDIVVMMYELSTQILERALAEVDDAA